MPLFSLSQISFLDPYNMKLNKLFYLYVCAQLYESHAWHNVFKSMTKYIFKFHKHHSWTAAHRCPNQICNLSGWLLKILLGLKNYTRRCSPCSSLNFPISLSHIYLIFCYVTAVWPSLVFCPTTKHETLRMSVSWLSSLMFISILPRSFHCTHASSI